MNGEERFRDFRAIFLRLFTAREKRTRGRGRKDIDKMPANNVSSLRLPAERDRVNKIKNKSKRREGWDRDNPSELRISISSRSPRALFIYTPNIVDRNPSGKLFSRLKKDTRVQSREDILPTLSRSPLHGFPAWRASSSLLLALSVVQSTPHEFALRSFPLFFDTITRGHRRPPPFLSLTLSLFGSGLTGNCARV